MGELSNWYTSVAGIAAASVAVGAGVRQWLGAMPGWNRVPLVVYVLVSCVGLSAVAQYGMRVELAENFLQLIVPVVTSTLMAVGAVSFGSNAMKPLAETVSKK